MHYLEDNVGMWESTLLKLDDINMIFNAKQIFDGLHEL